MHLIRKRDVGFMFYTIVVLALRLLPAPFVLKHSATISRRLARIWLRLVPGERRQTLHNLKLILGESKSPEELENIVLDQFEAHSWVFIANDLLPRLSREQLQAMSEIRGRENLEAALRGGKGAVMFTGHYGVHGYVVMALLVAHGIPVTAVFGHEVQPDDSWVYRKLIYPIRSRARYMLPISDRGQIPNPDIVRTLRQNGALVVQCDNHLTDEQISEEHHIVSVPFLWGMAPLRSGPFRLPKIVGAPAIPVFVTRRGARVTIEFDKPLTLAAGHTHEAVAADMGAYMALLGQRIKATPEQWGFTRHSNIATWIRPIPAVDAVPASASPVVSG